MKGRDAVHEEFLARFKSVRISLDLIRKISYLIFPLFFPFLLVRFSNSLFLSFYTCSLFLSFSLCSFLNRFYVRSAKARTTLDISMSPRDDQSRFLFPILFNEVSPSYRIRSNTGAYHLTFHWYRRFNAARVTNMAAESKIALPSYGG